MSTNTMIAGVYIVGGTFLAGATTPPIAELFNEATLALAMMGAMGGISFALWNKVPWRDVIRPGVLGASLAVGLSTIGPGFIEKVFEVGIDVEDGGLSLLGSVAYIVGFAQERIADYLIRRKKEAPEDEQ